MDWEKQAQHIKAVALDIDGVLTDGRLCYGPDGGISKWFDARDGHAMKMAIRAGLKVGMLSGRDDPVNRHRADDLALSFTYFGKKDKGKAFDELLTDLQLEPANVLYMGDDVIDIPVLRRAGIGVCVADAPDEVAAESDWRTSAPSGCGAVRETIVRLLKSQGKWDEQMERYLK